MKLPIFNGNGTDDLEQYWFFYEVIWTARQLSMMMLRKVSWYYSKGPCARMVHEIHADPSGRYRKDIR